MADAGAKKCRQYNVEYLKCGFIPLPHNEQSPFRLICKKFLKRSHEAFPSLKELGECPSDDMLLLFTKHPKSIEDDMKLGFQNLSDLKIPPWILDPFEITDIDMDESTEREFIDL